MKTLASMANADRAKLLHQLFPGEIPEFLKYVTGMSRTIHEEQEAQRNSWPEGHLLTFDFWLSLAAQAENTIEKNGSKLCKSSSFFADQLFGVFNYGFLFPNHCLITYVTVRQHPNPKFSQAVELLFKP